MTKNSVKKKDEKKQEKIILPEDLIGRDRFVSRINNIIKSANKEGFWTFAINGKWGTGKSYVLSMIEKDLYNSKDYFVVKYDAWKNDFYKDPLIAIIYNILDEIEKKTESIFKNVAKGIRAGLLMFYDIVKDVPGIKQIDEQAKKIKKATDKQRQRHIPEITQEFLSYNDAIKKLRIALTKLTRKCKLVILVDELDRCDYEYALTVLNRLHNVFEIPNSVSIVAVNKTQLETMLDNKYGSGSGKKYLEKFFDLTFELPESGDLDIRIKHAEKLFVEYMQEEDISKGGFYIQTVQSLLAKNAREVVKFFEKLKFVLRNIEDKDFNICDKNLKYDMLCLTTFLLSSNFDFVKFWNTDFRDDGRSSSIINVSSPNISLFVNKHILDYVETQRKVLGFGNIAQLYEDCEILRFFAMLNIVKYHGDFNIVQAVRSYFRVQFDNGYFGKINQIIDIICSLEHMQ